MPSSISPGRSRLFTGALGEMRALVDDEGMLLELGFIHRVTLPVEPGEPSALQRVTLDATVAQIGEYFAGKRRTFDLPLAPQGTPFQLRDWSALLEIPYGQTTTYGAIAERIGSISARAVGTANGSNPIAIIIPCHRVIGASGKLVGYGGGLDRKAALLELESRNVRLF